MVRINSVVGMRLRLKAVSLKSFALELLRLLKRRLISNDEIYCSLRETSWPTENLRGLREVFLLAVRLCGEVLFGECPGYRP